MTLPSIRSLGVAAVWLVAAAFAAGPVQAQQGTVAGQVTDKANQQAVAGVEVMQSGGATGSGSRVRIRGATSLSLSNEPIIVLDGIRMDNTAQAGGFDNFTGGQAPSRINDINPEDVESVEIVKGPSPAVLYGTDAANGVIQYRTKH